MNPKADGRYDFIFKAYSDFLVKHPKDSDSIRANILALGQLEVQMSIANELGRIADALEVSHERT